MASLHKPYKWLHSYVAGNKIYCVHQAENADVIREHASAGKFPANLVVEVAAVFDRTGPRDLPADRPSLSARRLPSAYRLIAAVPSTATMPTLRAIAARPSPVLFACLFASQAALLVLSPVLTDIAREFRTSTAAAGQLRTILGAAGGVTALSLALAGRRPGLRDMLLHGASLVLAGSVASALAPSFAVLAVAQAVIGVGIGLIVAIGIAAAGEWAAPGERPKTLAWAIAGMPAAWVVGMPLAGALLPRPGGGSRGSSSPRGAAVARARPAAAAPGGSTVAADGGRDGRLASSGGRALHHRRAAGQRGVGERPDVLGRAADRELRRVAGDGRARARARRGRDGPRDLRRSPRRRPPPRRRCSRC